MSKPYKFIVLRPNVYSLHFEEKPKYALYQMVQLLIQQIPELIEVTNTFNRINIFTPADFSTETLIDRLDKIDFFHVIILVQIKSGNFPFVLMLLLQLILMMYSVEVKQKLKPIGKPFWKLHSP